MGDLGTVSDRRRDVVGPRTLADGTGLVSNNDFFFGATLENLGR